jgi:hypothetical protein
MAEFDQIVFGKKKFSDLLKEVYDRSIEKEKQLTDMIDQLRDLIQNTGDAVMMVPLIASYMDMNLKNDDLLIKMLAIVQKGMGRGKETGDYSLSEDEKSQLLQLAQENVAERKALTGANLPTS